MRDLAVIIALNHSSSLSKHSVKCLEKTEILFTSLGWSVLYILNKLTIIFLKNLVTSFPSKLDEFPSQVMINALETKFISHSL